MSQEFAVVSSQWEDGMGGRTGSADASAAGGLGQDHC